MEKGIDFGPNDHQKHRDRHCLPSLGRGAGGQAGQGGGKRYQTTTKSRKKVLIGPENTEIGFQAGRQGRARQGKGAEKGPILGRTTSKRAQAQEKGTLISVFLVVVRPKIDTFWSSPKKGTYFGVFS